MYGVLPIIDEGSSPKHVVFIVVDAARYDYLERFHTPHLNDLIKEGVSYRNMVAGTCIAGTNPGLATLSTGLFPRDHGIHSSFEWYDKNKKKLVYFYDAEKNILRMDAPTICDHLKEKNPTAKVCAISTKDRHAMLLGGKRADVIAYTYRESVFKRDVMGAYVGAGVSDDYFSWSERVNYSLPAYLKASKQERIVDWVGKKFKHLQADVADTALIEGFIMDGALKVLENERPDLLFIGLVSINIVTHQYGTGSVELEEVVEYTDFQIGRLMAKLKEMGWHKDTLLVITSDHGMSERPIGVDVQTLLKMSGCQDILDNIASFSSGGTGGLYLNDISPAIVERTLDVLRGLNHIQGAWYKYDKHAPWFIQRVAHERTMDIIIIPDYNSVILDAGKEVPNFAFYHGPPYAGDLSIWGIFSGAGVKKLGILGEPLDYFSKEVISEEQIRTIPEQVDVAPTVRTIMGI